MILTGVSVQLFVCESANISCFFNSVPYAYGLPIWQMGPKRIWDTRMCMGHVYCTILVWAILYAYGAK